MQKWFFAVAAYAVMWTPAHAGFVEVTFDDWKAAPVQVGDKVFTYIDGGDTFGNPDVVFSSTVFPAFTLYDMDIRFLPSLVNTVVDLDYSIQVTGGSEITGMGVDAQIGALGTNYNLTKTFYTSPGHVGQVAQLVSVNGSPDSVVGHFGQLLYVHVQATVPVGNDLDSFHDGYIQQGSVVPEPSSIALLGFGIMGLAGYRWKKPRKRNRSDAPDTCSA